MSYKIVTLLVITFIIKLLAENNLLVDLVNNTTVGSDALSQALHIADLEKLSAPASMVHGTPIHEMWMPLKGITHRFA